MTIEKPNKGKPAACLTTFTGIVFIQGLLITIFWLFLAPDNAERWFTGVPTWRTGSLLWLGLGFLSFAILRWRFPNPAQWVNRLLTVGIVTLAALLAYAASLYILRGKANHLDLRNTLLLAAPLMGWLGLIAIECVVAALYRRSPRSILGSWRSSLSADAWRTILALVLLALVVAVLFPSAPISRYRIPWNDSAIFVYSGQQIVTGRLPYVDFWDHKPPLVFYLNALGLLIGAESMWGVWLLEVAFLWITGLLAFNTLRRMYGNTPAGFIVATGLVNLALLLQRGNLTEQYALLFQWVAFLGLVIIEERGVRPALAVGAGIAGGLAFLLKQNLIGLWLVVGLLWLWRACTENRRYWAAVGGLAAGFAVVQLIPVIYFAGRRILGEYWDVAFSFNFKYSGVTMAEKFTSAGQTLSDLWTASSFFAIGLLAWVAGVIWLMTARSKPGAVRILLIAAVLDLPIELALISIPARNYPHYYMAAWPALLILVCWGLYGLRQTIQTHHLRREIAMVVFLVPFFWLPGKFLIEQYPVETEVTISQTVAYIRGNTSDPAPVLVWSGEPAVYAVARRPAPSRYFFLMPLFQQGYTSQERVDQFLTDLIANPPVVLVDTHNPSTPLVTVDSAGHCTYPAANLPDGMRAVYDYFCAHYRPVQVIGKDEWIIYQKAD